MSEHADTFATVRVKEKGLRRDATRLLTATHVSISASTKGTLHYEVLGRPSLVFCLGVSRIIHATANELCVPRNSHLDNPAPLPTTKSFLTHSNPDPTFLDFKLQELEQRHSRQSLTSSFQCQRSVTVALDLSRIR